MKFEQLRVQGLRCLDDVSVAPGPGLNLFVGRNGAGKTSLLEAAYLLSYGRTFRNGSKDALLQRDKRAMQVYGEIRDQQAHVHRLGLGRESGAWSIRINGTSAERLSDLVRHCAVVCFEPGSHALIAGAAEERRRFLDWGVFHVKHDFLAAWQRYRRALKQRNALLRSSTPASDALLAPWEQEMHAVAQPVDELRRHYLADLEATLRELCRQILPELGELTLHYRRGWDANTPLADTLARQRERDRMRGYTTEGIHRADWRPVFAHAPQREHLSRGQEKLCALACVLAQAQVYASSHGEWPVICLDDLASELDVEHQAAVVALLKNASAQVLITGTATMDALPTGETTMFHVEHGRVTAM